MKRASWTFLVGLVACGNSSGSDGPKSDSGVAPAGEDAGGAEGSGSCFLTVCNDPSACTAAGVGTVDFGCPTGAVWAGSEAQGDGGLMPDLSTIVLVPPTATSSLYINVSFAGDPLVTTYTTQSVGTLPAAPSILFESALCYENANGSWLMTEPSPGLPDLPAPPAVGSFSLTLTNVTTGPGEDAADGYFASGALHMVCAPDPTTNAQGTITIDAKF
ncbi:MAG: hypothetical protein ABSC94_12885 [Polyangiaceae bacterium]|jgi:hypothetical protein